MRKFRRIPCLKTFFPLVLILMLILAACGPTTVEVAEVVEEIQSTNTSIPPTPLPDQSILFDAWTSGAHSIYDLGHGPNTWCARCHSPQNWDPEAFQGPPPSCFSCKMAGDEEVRIAEGNPFIPEEEWIGINCDTCHRVDKNGIASAEIAWFDPIKMSYSDVNTPTELCEKCHVTTTGNAFGSAVDHQIYFGGSAHLNYGGFLGEVAPPQYCTDCHDSHTLEPKTCEDCHDVSSDPVMSSHEENVTCIACHNALEFTSAGVAVEYGPHPDETMSSMWVPQITTMGRGGPSTDTVSSHSIVYEVSCDRCHFEGNAFDLQVLTADGEVPEEGAETGGQPGG